MNDVKDRDALYYPYIHVRDINWLKATLLCFPKLYRMVPSDFHLNDSPEVIKFRETEGLRGRLLDEFDLNQEFLEKAQKLLMDRLAVEDESSLRRFSRQKTLDEFKGKDNSLQIHRDKFFGQMLYFLEEKGLLWEIHEKNKGGDIWVGVHPKLGETIMSVIAIAIANTKGLDIVTSSDFIHFGLATQNQEAVISSLFGDSFATSPQYPKEDIIDELTQVVIKTKFDVSKLSLDTVIGLIKDGKGLHKFKTALGEIAKSIPTIPDPEARANRLKEKADEIIEEWEKYEKSLPSIAKEALGESFGKKLPELASKSLSGLVAGAALTTTLLGAANGFAVGMIVCTGISIWKKYAEKANNPYRYLSNLEKAGASLMLTANKN